ncbi:4-(cytidine 5'-diphospho)-2-C-methyl-D-erythritol kinase [Aestuariispira insulae]|uniref:4-diphosphocytidyl-2-C-methyl-D-erythritol kinase n=1 Tax=Aestuariispira insulae TaxID=1461337 RepID=A0A3D9HQS7_9PROT|nr:4-(cytidine 5'-diphospho)-2-C-methyl-D-erythritol kinase [Aestuariispira insulae]RED51266.1 4-diphosphocytidyl-2-C-methyl-D-erythritol kinase [Aestuariispira insulae]
MKQERVTAVAPAKVNLYLHVTGRRDDGYHLLDSLVVFTEFGDRVTVSPAPDLTLSVGGPFAAAIPNGGDNLVLRAARALQQAAGVTAGAAIHLEKFIPVAAGVGGGSADAAAVLKTLMRLWELTLEQGRLEALALALGADVPVCLESRSAYMGGIGEDLTAAPDIPKLGILLANPGIGLSTPAVFKARTSSFSDNARLTPGELATRTDFINALSTRNNDLSEPAVSLVPEVGDLLVALGRTDHCLLARMSGSGATCFALYEDQAAAEKAAESLGNAWPDLWLQASNIR